MVCKRREEAARRGRAAQNFPFGFVGRDEQVREVAGLLGRHRLVTVTGPGGVGKTRLASRVARAVAGGFADGAWLAELAPVSDPAQVAAVVAAALAVREQPGVPAAGAAGADAGPAAAGAGAETAASPRGRRCGGPGCRAGQCAVARRCM